MNKHTTLVGTAVLSAFVGGTVVWSVMKSDSGAEIRNESVSEQASRPNGPANASITEAAVGEETRTLPVSPAQSGAASGTQVAAERQIPAQGKEVPPVSESSDASRQRAAMRRNDATVNTTVNIGTAQATIIDQVVVPIPSEIFAVLDKMGKPQWRDVMRPVAGVAGPRGGVEETALMLGYTIAEGFVAVEAEDVAKVKEIGRSVLTLAEAIGVRKAVIRRSNAILEMADRRDWARVRKEFDGALGDVKDALIELNSAATADLVSLGGWIRGTNALANVVRVDYSEDAAGLLHQPGLIDHFSNRISVLPQRTRDLPIVTTLQKSLAGIRPLMGTGAVSKEAVDQIGQMTTSLVQLIEGK